MTRQQATELAVPGEQCLTLADGRTLAYSQSGDVNSRKIAVVFHGVFGVGNATGHMDRFLASVGWRLLAPTLPGWGRSSPLPTGFKLSDFPADVASLLTHVLGDGNPPTHLVFFGGSYGSIWAHACAANPNGAIKPASAIRGLIIMGGFSPFDRDADYTDGMSWANWIAVGKPGQWFPLNWVSWTVGRIMRKKIAGTLDGSIAMLRSILTGPSAMTAEERAQITGWALENGSTFDEWERSMAANMAMSVQYTIDGFDRVGSILNSDWGFDLGDIQLGTDEQRAAKREVMHAVPGVLPPVVVFGCTRDHSAHMHMQRYVAAHVAGAQLIEMPGNHIGGIVSLKPLFAAVIAGIEAHDAAATL